MILVTRRSGHEIFINAELIETVEATPDTVITLVNQKKYLVRESPEEILARVIEYRRQMGRWPQKAPAKTPEK
ncbi:MAG: flagellar FlbD family protein [Firmicutes bacterium]|nr:flagellar FlbD family protein [Bacillota bacterium]MCL5039516.1 flagellar FlbD family protein [Bacillota bacterium]